MTLRFEKKEGVAILLFSRPEVKNAFDLSTLHRLRELLERVENDPSVSSILLSGEGGSFSSGGDVKEMAKAPDIRGHFLQLTGEHHASVLILRRTPKPVVTAVDGVAAGGGVGLALCGDARIGTPRATFVSAFEALGVHPDGGITYLLPKIVGEERAREFLERGGRIGSKEALDLGILHRIVPPETLLEVAKEEALRLARNENFTKGEDLENLRRALDLERERNAESAYPALPRIRRFVGVG